MPVGFYNTAWIGRTVNTYGLQSNCYFVSTAALMNMSVEELFRATETMQQVTGNDADIKTLFADAGEAVQSTRFDNLGVLYQQLLSLPAGASVGLAYSRHNQSVGHMLVVQRDPGWTPLGAAPGLRCIDYQQTPPKVTNFPPEPNISSSWVYYRS
ncbi:MAG: hypothetical protein HOI23_09980 [Deltaproteobacteria bacterium]|jgi:hypothetical protein|nr:hypothetical protein [Deltaproteobacteria bacterium]MBT6435461.1 hypothetical protein [Deltaproteobacteria bacterium]